MKPETAPDIVPDSEQRGLIGALPAAVRPYASLIRLDRPIGAWLLFWPCAWSVALAGGAAATAWVLILWLALGAWAMRGAGCVYNDIVDRDLDAKVERTRLRPLASRRVSLGARLGPARRDEPDRPRRAAPARTARAQLVALASLAPVAAYPFMKRITWWPQAWLGLVFSWGALVGWPAVKAHLGAPAWLLWAGSIFWVIGYDTIYALQDKEDDALVGVRSSALALGRHARLGVAVFYLVALGLWAVSLHLVRPEWFALLALLPVALHLALAGRRRSSPTTATDALAKFRSNRTAGLLMFLACLVVGDRPPEASALLARRRCLPNRRRRCSTYVKPRAAPPP